MLAPGDHVADLDEPREAVGLGPAERVTLEMRNDPSEKVGQCSGLVLDGSVTFVLSYRTASEKGVQIVDQVAVSLVQPQCEGRPDLDAGPQLAV